MKIFCIWYFQGGKSARIVNCVLALKSYSDWKQGGGNGSWKFGGNLKPSVSGTGKPFMRKSSEPFMNSFSRTSSVGEKSLECVLSEQADLGHDLNEAVSELCFFLKCLCFSHDVNKPET